ncbi:MAG TPA: hypothetical protein PKL08_08030, partial [Thermoanaerobaculaceae bacterium]|nr:hypothetical protein [Thermoanaerobaculaceae bacterium]
MKQARVLLVAVVAAWLALPVWADYKQKYSDGIKALETRNWADAARLLREAAAEQPQEGERIKLYGMRFEIYLPHFYLGQVLVQTNDCPGALKAFVVSEEQGKVQATDQWGELQRLRDRCQKQSAAATLPSRPPVSPTPDLGGQVRRAEAELTRAGEIEKAVAELRRTAAPVWQEQPALAARANEATNRLAGARNALLRGRSTGSAAEIESATTQASESARDLSLVKDQVGARWSELQEAEAQRLGQLAEAAKQEEARRQALQREVAALSQEAAALAGTVGAAAARLEVQQAQAELGQARSRADAVTAAGSASELQARNAELQRAVNRLRQVLAATPPAPSPPAAAVPTAPLAAPTAGQASAPPPLREASEAFLGADYRRAV